MLVCGGRSPPLSGTPYAPRSGEAGGGYAVRLAIGVGLDAGDASPVSEGVPACADHTVAEVLLADTVVEVFLASFQSPVHLAHHGVSCAVVVSRPAVSVATLDVAVSVHHGGLHGGSWWFRCQCQLGGGDAHCEGNARKRACDGAAYHLSCSLAGCFFHHVSEHLVWDGASLFFCVDRSGSVAGVHCLAFFYLPLTFLNLYYTIKMVGSQIKMREKGGFSRKIVKKTKKS